MANIVFLEVEQEDAALVQEAFPDAKTIPGVLQEHELIAECKDAEVISCFIHTKFSAETIAALPTLKLLCTRSVGFDHIDLQACNERGIIVVNVPDYGSHVIAEHVFALLLSTLRHIPEGDKRVKSGEFEYRGLRGMALKGKTIGILGTGKIGRCVARIAHGFDMRILATDQCRTLELEKDLGVQYVPFEELLSQSDILTLHIPATPDTDHVFNAQAFTLLKHGVILINTARGSLIDSAALLSALKTGQIAYALLDVLEHEMNFQESAELTKHPHVVTTPHIAFYADDSMRKMFTDCFESIHEWKRGKEPAHVVRPPTIICDVPGVKK